MGKYERGFGALEIMICLVITALATAAGANIYQKYVDRQFNLTAAEQMNIVADAAGRYIKDNYSSVSAVATPSTPATITIPMLITTGYLPTGFSSKNPYGQDYSILTLEPTANQFKTLIVTSGGDTIKDLYLYEISKQVGASGGYISSADTSVATGSFGGWQTALAPYGVSPGAGHLATALFFADGAIVTDYLYRNSVPGHPELNRMNTALDMGSHDINNAATVNAGTAKIAGETYTGGWFRTTGDGGWYSEKWGGGWYMSDPTWLRSFNNKNVYTAGEIRGGKLTSEGRTEVGEYLQLDGIAVEGNACSPNGLLGRDAAGLTLSCQSGVWTGNVGIGYGQTWQLVPRALNTTYVNSTRQPIMIAPSIYCFGVDNFWKKVFIYVGGVLVGQFDVLDADGGDQNTDIHPATFIVPPGQSYAVTSTNTAYCSIVQWAELRL